MNCSGAGDHFNFPDFTLSPASVELSASGAATQPFFRSICDRTVPVIISQPVSFELVDGTVSISECDDDTAVSHQWKPNGTDISGADRRYVAPTNVTNATPEFHGVGHQHPAATSTAAIWCGVPGGANSTGGGDGVSWSDGHNWASGVAPAAGGSATDHRGVVGVSDDPSSPRPPVMVQIHSSCAASRSRSRQARPGSPRRFSV